MGTSFGRNDGGSQRFRDAFADMTAANMDSGIAKPQSRGALGLGLNLDFDKILRAAAIAQGDYGAAAQLGQRQRTIADDLAEYEAKQQIEQKYRAPKEPDEFTRHMQAAGIDPNSPQGQTLYQQHVASMANPPHMVVGPDGIPRFISNAPPAAPVGKLTPIPDMGGAAPGAGVPFGGGIDEFKRAIIGQESGGRYGIPNAEGSGAMGIGQQMPATAQALASRLGLPWRPDLMAGQHPEARQYQDAITNAAVQEAWNASNGDPSTAAMYYYGGSNRKIWGPKTRRYATDILSRMRGA